MKDKSLGVLLYDSGFSIRDITIDDDDEIREDVLHGPRQRRRRREARREARKAERRARKMAQRTRREMPTIPVEERHPHANVELRIAIKEMDRICRYCMSAPAETVDHISPRSRGGSNAPYNLVGCCQACNSKKGNMTPKEAGMKLHCPPRLVMMAVNR